MVRRSIQCIFMGPTIIVAMNFKPLIHITLSCFLAAVPR